METTAEEVRQAADAAVRRLMYWLEGIQYKPGWMFTAFLHEHELGKVMIRIEAKLLDASVCCAGSPGAGLPRRWSTGEAP
jgi:hypothetical protein